MAARKRAIASTSSSAPGDIPSSEAPWPRWSYAIAAQPAAAQARPKSPWFSLRDPAPWTITIPGQGGSVSGSHSQYGRPSWAPVTVGGSGEGSEVRLTSAPTLAGAGRHDGLWLIITLP